MLTFSENRINYKFLKGNKDIVIYSFVLLALLLLATINFNLPIIYYFIIAASIFIIMMSFNVKFVYSLLVIALFIKTSMILNLYFSLYVVPFLTLSCILTGKKIDAAVWKSPINQHLLIYLFAMFLSLYNSIKLIGSLNYMTNYVVFILIIFFTQIIYSNNKNGIKQIYVLLLMVLVNSTYLFITYRGARSFGFTGMMFVDYVALGLLITLMIYFYSRKYKNFFLILSLIIAVAMILTQTRGVWIAFSISFLIMILILFLKNKELYMKRKHIVIFCAAFIAAVAVFFVTSENISSSTTKRVENLTTLNTEDIESGFVGNSLLTRVFIWHTCYNAFMDHPIIGIGAYSFPFASRYYYSLPKMFQIYVGELTPHETFIAVLTETGIIGFIAFIALLTGIIKILIKIIRLSNTYEDARISVIYLSANIYIMCSMLISDAWLWGHGIVLWGIVLGLTLSHFNYLSQNKTVINE